MEYLYGWCVWLLWCWLVVVGGLPFGLIVGRIRYLDVKDVEMLNMSSKEDSDQIINDKLTIIVLLLIKKKIYNWKN